MVSRASHGWQSCHWWSAICTPLTSTEAFCRLSGTQFGKAWISTCCVVPVSIHTDLALSPSIQRPHCSGPDQPSRNSTLKGVGAVSRIRSTQMG